MYLRLERRPLASLTDKVDHFSLDCFDIADATIDGVGVFPYIESGGIATVAPCIPMISMGTGSGPTVSKPRMHLLLRDTDVNGIAVHTGNVELRAFRDR